MPFNSNDDKSSTPTENIWLESVIHQIDDDRYFYEVRFRAIGGTIGFVTVPRSDTLAARNIVKVLLDAGWDAGGLQNPQTAVETAMTLPPRRTEEVTKRPGWHDDTFAGFGFSAGPKKDTLRLDAAEKSRGVLGTKSGHLKKWKDGLAEPCSKSSYLSFGIGVAFASPLMKLIGEDEGALFHFHGESASGKSLAGRACQSVFGRARKNDLSTFSTTVRALEEGLATGSDMAMVLDEFGRIEGSAKSVREFTRMLGYSAAGGVGRSRSAVVSTSMNLQNLTWRVCGLTTGEVALASEATGARNKGELVRHIDVPIPPRKKSGVFDRIVGDDGVKKSPKDLAQLVEAAIELNFGVAFKRYIGWLTSNRDVARSQAIEHRDKFVSAVTSGQDAWETRFASKFGLVFAGMLAACDAGVAH